MRLVRRTGVSSRNCTYVLNIKINLISINFFRKFYWFIHDEGIRFAEFALPIKLSELTSSSLKPLKTRFKGFSLFRNGYGNLP